eukprot:jgi/Bigna1/77094/fgenesh1_pg.45_\
MSSSEWEQDTVNCLSKIHGDHRPAVVIFDLDSTLWNCNAEDEGKCEDHLNLTGYCESSKNWHASCRIQIAHLIMLVEHRHVRVWFLLLAESRSCAVLLYVAYDHRNHSMALLNALGLNEFFDPKRICVFPGSKDVHIRKICAEIKQPTRKRETICVEMGTFKDNIDIHNAILIDDLSHNRAAAKRTGTSFHLLLKKGSLMSREDLIVALQNFASKAMQRGSFRKWFTKRPGESSNDEKKKGSSSSSSKSGSKSSSTSTDNLPLPPVIKNDRSSVAIAPASAAARHGKDGNPVGTLPSKHKLTRPQKRKFVPKKTNGNSVKEVAKKQHITNFFRPNTTTTTTTITAPEKCLKEGEGGVVTE